MSRRKTRTCRMISFKDLMRSEVSRARRKVHKKRSLKAAAAALGGDQAYERPSEGEGTTAREPRGMGMGVKSNLLGVG
jgi:hypothetical protein